MIQYSDDLKEEIRSANDIVDVISQYVTLKRKGKIYFGLCPFHREKSPSFSVSPDKQFFHCFGCGKGGDVFTFISEIERLSFFEAIKFLAERGHVVLPTLENDAFNEKQYLKDRLYLVNIEATNYFHERLYQPIAKIAQNYVKERKLDNSTLKAFKIGYSGEYNELYKHLKSKGFKENEIIGTGLVYKNDRGEFIDRYRKRLMFPIMSVSGKVVAFGGRRLDNNENVAKYINSNENLIYSKKQHLFALNIAKQSDLKQIILVEGYMDAISLHQRGIHNVVASLGTALTEEQGRLLRRYSEQVLMCYDSDGAGQSAIMRGLEVLQNQGIDARVIQMEGAKDPDEYIIKYGSERFNLLSKNAISLVEFRVKMLKSNYNLENATDKIKFLKQITKILSEVENKIEREIYIDNISRQYNISKEAIYVEVNKELYKNSNSDIKILNKPKLNISDVEKNEEISETVLKREKVILYLLINYYEESIVDISSNIVKEDFKLDINGKIYEIIINSKESSKEKILQILSNIEDSEMQSQISEIMLSDYEINSVEKCIEDVIISYTKERLNARKTEILKQLESSGNENLQYLESELNSILIELAKIK